MADSATILEWAGAVCGLTGAFLLAINTYYSRYGWIAFFVANIALIAFSILIDRYGLLLQQIGFLGTSFLGLYRTGFLNLKR